MKKIVLAAIVLSFLVLPTRARASAFTDFIEWLIPSALRVQPIQDTATPEKGVGGILIYAEPEVMSGDTQTTFYMPALGTRSFTIQNGGAVDLFLNKSASLRYGASPSLSPGDTPTAYALNVGEERTITIYNPATTTNYYLFRTSLGISSTGTTTQSSIFLTDITTESSLVESVGGKSSIASYEFGFTLNNATNKDVYISRLINTTKFVTLSPILGATVTTKFIETDTRVQAGDNASAYVIPAGNKRHFDIIGIVDNTRGTQGPKTLSVASLQYSNSSNLSTLQFLPAIQLNSLKMIINLGAGELPNPVSGTSTPSVIAPPVTTTPTTTTQVIATTTAELVITSATTTIGIPLVDNGKIVGYPVTFSFSAQALGKAVYLSKTPSVAFATLATGFGSLLPTINNITAPPDTRDGGSHFVLQPGSTRSFKVFAVLRNDGISKLATQTFQISTIKYGFTSTNLKEMSTTQNTNFLKATVKLPIAISVSTPTLSPSVSPTPSPSISSSPTASPSASPELIALCYAVPTNPRVGDVVTWQVMQTGGSNTPTFNWAGTDDLKGSTASVKKTYSSVGKKTAFVAVVEDGQTVSVSCYVNVSASSSPSPSPSSTASPSSSPVASPSSEAPPPAPSPSGSSVSLQILEKRGMVAATLYSLGEFLDSLFVR